jgi:hypothetical protein
VTASCVARRQELSPGGCARATKRCGVAEFSSTILSPAVIEVCTAGCVRALASVVHQGRGRKEAIMSTPQNLSLEEMSTVTGGVASATSTSSSLQLYQLKQLSHSITDVVKNQQAQQQQTTQTMLFAAMAMRMRQ